MSTIFGSTANKPATTGFGGFGTNTNPTNTGTNNLFGGFGATNTNTTNQQQAGQTPTAGTSLFGNTNTNQSAGGTTLFGGGTANQPGTGSSLFGNAAGAAQPLGTAGGSLFGGGAATGTNTTGGGLFGTQPAGANTTSTGLFGTQSAAGTSTTGQSSSLFGGQNKNIFGQPTTNTNTQTQPLGTGLFGQNNQAQQNQPGTGAGLFGQTNAQNQLGTGTGLFGQTNTQNQSGTGTGLFGQTQNQNQLNTGTGLFGQTNTQNTGTGLFGQTNAQNQPNTGTGLFSQTQNQPSTGTGLFGQTQQQNTVPGGSLFGGTFGQANNQGQQNQQQTQPTSFFGNLGQQQNQQQQPQQQSSLFGTFGQSTNAGTNTTGGLGSSIFGAASTTTAAPTTLLGSSALGASRNTLGSMQIANSSDGAQAQFTSMVQRIEAIAQAWDPSSPQCPFQYFFYNLVDPSQVHMYGRPPNATDEVRWQKALRENPDPSCFVPALAVGFDDLQKRVDAQKQQSTAHQEKLTELKTRISSLTEKHFASHSPRLHRALAYQNQLTQRLTRLCQHLHLLIPSVRSSSIRPEEESLRSTLESLEDEIRKPGGAGRLKAKLSELWALVGAMEAARERNGLRKGMDGEGSGWTVVDQEGLQRITQILTVQQNGLAHLTKIAQKHLDDLDIIYGQEPRHREEDAFAKLQQKQQGMNASTLGLPR